MKFLKLCLIFLLLLSGLATAEEGMWMLNQLDLVPWSELQQQGLELSPAEIRTWHQGVVLFGDGGTGVFVSGQGLLLTNHHVAEIAIQNLSNLEQNYHRDGYLTRKRPDEIPIPDYAVYITTTIQDVTAQILADLKAELSPQERFKALENRKQEIEDKAEKEQNQTARVIEFYSGTRYYLCLSQRFNDVRLVYSPPTVIGNFGGEVDNFQWPRHSGDFCFLRVYAAPDGEPADYTTENIPYNPRKYFPISVSGFNEKDLTMVLGYPAGTARYQPAAAVEYDFKVKIPLRIKMIKTSLAVMEQEAANDPDVALKIVAFISALNNELKYYQGLIDGAQKIAVVAKKRQRERELQRFFEGSPDLKSQYGTLLADINSLYADLKTCGPWVEWHSMNFDVPLLPNVVYLAYRYALEKEKPEAEQNVRYSKRRIQEFIDWLKLTRKQYVATVDKGLFKSQLFNLIQFSTNKQSVLMKQILGTRTDLDEEAIAAYVERIYTQSQFNNLEETLPLFDESLLQLKARPDPLLTFSTLLTADMEHVEKKYQESECRRTLLTTRYVEALLKWKGKKLYPDANFTLRFSYGTVRGYTPCDGVLYTPQTCLTGVVAKHSDQPEFEVPLKLLRLAQNKDYGPYADVKLQDVPVNFMHTTDTTGGHSGSPTLNSKGALIGLVFDGNYESIITDYHFDLSFCRTVSVDIRYVLFILDKFAGAPNILEELEIVP
ncbi:S46 family peptidase [candidate division CSSED10-310 bacterium]|uniref:Dipeptidyl-peptidase n=1 Tax=candidate division CSSED10-310 bacterium TaxID=2855610 RepID=A0ABV6Z2Y7_UNCC1